MNMLKMAQSLRELDDKLVKCMRCGTCQSVCPVFAESLAEGDVARGKIALISNLANEILSDADGARKRLDRCLLCGSCQTACPSGVKILDIFMQARIVCAEYMGLPPVKKLVFRRLLCRPKLFAFLAKFTPLAKLILRDEHNPQHTCHSPLLTPAVGSRHIPQLPPKTFSDKYGAIDIKPATPDKPTVLFFPGCMGDKLYVSTTEACVKILKHHGLGVKIPKNMSCCGIPALASGDADAFNTMLKQNLALLKNVKFDYFITACASCTETVKKFWSEYADTPEAAKQAASIGSRTMDISDFLVNVLRVDEHASDDTTVPEQTTPPKLIITYHDSCHLKKALGISQEPRRLIQLNKNYQLVEMDSPDSCCGCGGSFTLTHYDLSKKIGTHKAENIERSRADIVATGCPACMMQITNMLAARKSRAQVKHVAEIYAETLKQDI